MNRVKRCMLLYYCNWMKQKESKRESQNRIEKTWLACLSSIKRAWLSSRRIRFDAVSRFETKETTGLFVLIGISSVAKRMWTITHRLTATTADGLLLWLCCCRWNYNRWCSSIAVNNINLAAASQMGIEIYRKQHNFDEVESEKEREGENSVFTL